MPTIHSVEELAELVGDRNDLYLRWSSGPDADADGRSRDALTGVELLGLSVNALTVEPWWGGRSRQVWAARRLYDYDHLGRRRDRNAKPWILTGRPCGRGPDNEPLLSDVQPVAWIGPAVAREARRIIEDLNDDWGSLDRSDTTTTGHDRCVSA